MGKIADIDYKKFFIQEGEAGFNPVYNKHIIEKTINKSEKARQNRQKHYNELVAERVSAVTDYLFSGTDKPIEQYFGKKTMAMLRGLQIQDTIRLSGGTNVLNYRNKRG